MEVSLTRKVIPHRKLPNNSRMQHHLTNTSRILEIRRLKHGGKLTVYNAVITSKLLYGLETVALNLSQIKKIDAAQMKGLRQILKAPTTFYDRTYTNEKHIGMANERLAALQKSL